MSGILQYLSIRCFFFWMNENAQVYNYNRVEGKSTGCHVDVQQGSGLDGVSQGSMVQTPCTVRPGGKG